MQLQNQTHFYKGKVRDVYTIKNQYLVMVASNRISAFDVILPPPIPYKGQVLNLIANYFLKATSDIVPNWILDVPLPHVSIGKKCTPFQVEMVIRGNLTGHAWRTYKSGLRTLCGEPLPEGLKENDFFPKPIITPTTKAHVGHDEDISKEDILKNKLVSEEDYAQLETYTYALFERGKQMAEKQGLILADTKYEFGKTDNTIYLIDEIHTPDSSRYFYADNFNEQQAKGLPQKQLSKEFVREWLIAHNFMGLEGQTIPEMNEDFIQQISERYIELFEKITGMRFQKETYSESQIESIINQRLQLLP
ncbi:MAG: phosphoribosylaminoimidazolesuccinocarboxamide synthase [Chitinophagaceae bacterium]|nr:MAG: phosphoribosylaminoimidazolesuccinocarboxamide synthase [Bacteroidetes bacterium OLB11]MCC6448221.1 phosphoribosylaminoimidazolesuccinocarboxamide synthase [Chitinophagaceae bacterium]HMN32212.1 phosphoribosylaminoimidazolesuccinocarboxamide synthase [Chitinophagaceae bacterium]